MTVIINFQRPEEEDALNFGALLMRKGTASMTLKNKVLSMSK